MRNKLRHKKQQEHRCTFRLSKKMRSPLGPLCEGAPPAGGGGENCAVARNISGYRKVLSLADGGFSTLLYIAMFLLFLLGWLLQSVTNRSASPRHSRRFRSGGAS